MAHTTDGSTWRSMLNPPVNIGDVNGVRRPLRERHQDSRNDQVGYVFGQSAFFMTTDGGATWTHQSGGAYALETLDGNVNPAGCRPQRLPWPVQPASRTVDDRFGDVEHRDAAGRNGQHGLGRAVADGGDAFITTFTGQAGSLLPRVLYISTDDGHNWTRHADACATPESFVTVNAMTSADGSLSVACWNGPIS